LKIPRVPLASSSPGAAFDLERGFSISVASHINRLFYILCDALQLTDANVSNPWPSNSSTFKNLEWYVNTNHAAPDIYWEH
jgi:hypothetical protein